MAKKDHPLAVYITADHDYYGEVSSSVMGVLTEFSPYVQVYSVDEAFVDLTGLVKLYKKNYYKLGCALRQKILDEIEIGMSEESQAGIAIYINKHLSEYREKNHGLLIITHSKWLVKTINADKFLNIEGMTKEEWLNRTIVPTDFEQLEKDSNALWREIENRIKKK